MASQADVPLPRQFPHPEDVVDVALTRHRVVIQVDHICFCPKSPRSEGSCKPMQRAELVLRATGRAIAAWNATHSGRIRVAIPLLGKDSYLHTTRRMIPSQYSQNFLDYFGVLAIGRHNHQDPATIHEWQLCSPLSKRPYPSAVPNQEGGL